MKLVLTNDDVCFGGAIAVTLVTLDASAAAVPPGLHTGADGTWLF